MEPTTEACLFGDQTLNVGHGLRRLLQIKTSPSLEGFFQKALQTLRYEYARLSVGQKQPGFRFSTLEDLLTARDENSLPTAFEPTLTCLYQLGLFIRYHDQPGNPFPQESKSVLLGLCTGGLSAAAVSCSTSIPDLVETSVLVTQVAFRTGQCVSDMRQRLSPSTPTSSASWALLALDIQLNEANTVLDAYASNKVLSKLHKPYVSSVSSNSVTISGTPAALQELRQLQSFGKSRLIDLPISAPFHASHLYSTSDIENILSDLELQLGILSTAKHATISSSTGHPYRTSNLRGRLQESLQDILLKPIHFDALSKGVFEALQWRQSRNLSLCSVGSTAGDTVCAATQQLSVDAGLDINIARLIIEEPRQLEEQAKGRFDRSKLAIIGMSGRYPGADNNEEFWELLRQGLDVHKEAPALHWDVATHVDLEGKRKNTSATPYGCWLETPGLWDARFFNISPREAPQIDPAQRLALLTAYEAIEQAGIVPGATPSTEKDRVGIFYGVTSNDWMETNSAQNIDTYFIPGGNRAFIPGRINYFFKFSGPSYAIDTACSSSLAAIHVACNSLWRGDVDTAIAGGTNILTNPDFTAGLDRGHFLSRTGNCKTFDDGADGYCRGEAVGTVILKRLEDALADKDHIQGIILGAQTNHSAEAESITRPHPQAQKEIFHRILNQAGVQSQDVSYVEMHGTGTQAGDAGEMSSVLSVFAPKVGRQTPLYLGSAKANIGHGEGASGISSLGKVLMMMQKNVIPPHCGIKTRINHKFPTDLDQRNVHIAKSEVSWPRPAGGVRRVFVNNFSAAGGNTALVIEDAPEVLRSDDLIDTRTCYPVTVSAKSAFSMATNLQSLLKYLDTLSNSKNTLAQLSYTTTARRIHHPHRVFLSGTSVADISSQLRSAIAENLGKNRPKAVPKLVFAFTGQGSQYPGMGRELFESFSIFRSEVLKLEQLARGHGLPAFKHLFTATNGDVNDYSPVIVQLASVCMQIALARLWESWGIKPTGGVVGHSLGEYAALNVAGVLSDSDTVYLVGRRAQLLVEQCTAGTHAMLAVLTSLDDITTRLRTSGLQYEIACLNAPRETVLSGLATVMAKAAEVLSKQGVKATLLRVPYAFHSSQVDPVLDEFETIASSVTYRKPTVPIISPLLGNTVTDEFTIGPKYLGRHCRETVNMDGAVRAARDTKTFNDDAIFVEFGPHPVVSGLVKASLGTHVRAISSMRRNKGTWQPLTAALETLYTAGADIRWAEFHRDFPASHKVLQLPAYSWDLKDYWMQYVNDWSLRKGDPASAGAQPIKSSPAPQKTVKVQSPPPAEAITLPMTTTVHTLVSETEANKTVSLVVESDISRSDLNPLVQGHMVNGIPLCTPSVYADIALTLGKYLAKKYQPGRRDQLVDVGELAVEKALIAAPVGPQILRTTVTLDLHSSCGKVVFASVNNNTQRTKQHAFCTIKCTDRSELAAAQAKMSQIKQRVDVLQGSLETGDTYRFNSRMAYLMVRGVAQFHDDYRCIEEVILSSDRLEAVGWIDFARAKKGGDFSVHPAYVDAMTQLGGFVMNANDGIDLDKEVFINHGWGSAQIYVELDGDKRYRNYVQMNKKKDDVYEGDVIIFDGDTVVAVFKNVELQRVPKRVLHHILAAESGVRGSAAAGSKSAPAKAATKPAAVQSVKQPVPVITAPVPAAPASAPARSPVATSNASSKLIEAALRLVGEESGLDVQELTNDTAWADIGVDSLLALVISSRLKEELAVDIDSSDFLTMPTVGELKKFLSANDTANDVPDTPAVENNEPPPLSQPFELIPPALPKPSSVSLPTVMAPTLPEPPATIPSAHSADFDRLLAIVSEESGVAIEDFDSDTNFADIGIDSLLALVITSRSAEELGLDLDGQFSVFIEYPTVGDMRRFLVGSQAGEEGDSSEQFHSSDNIASDESLPGISTPSSPAVNPTPLSEPFSDSEGVFTLTKSKHRATSVVLQGKKSANVRNLFLLPDGAGSAFSYSELPRIADDVVLIGLNCPFLREPELIEYGKFDSIMDLYLEEIRKRQPRGPYHLGGWSSGGIFAFRAAQRLMEEGETVSTLLLIDSPVPRGLDRLPQRFYDHLKKYNVFGQQAPASFQATNEASEPPEWLVPHFNATIDLLETYYADPLREGQLPKTCVIWATESALDGVKIPKLKPDPSDTEGMKFLSEKRTDLSPGEWSDLFPGNELKAFKVQGAHHFSMMRGQHAEYLVQCIRETLG